MALRELTPAQAVIDEAGVPTDRDLTGHELEILASHVASRAEDWAHHVAFDSDERVYVSLHRDHHVDVWLLCWTPENDTGFHDHDTSSGAVSVVSGALVENNLTFTDGVRQRHVGAGSTFSFGPDHIHRLNGAAHTRSRCTPTARRCGGWVSTGSTTTGPSSGSPCRTPTSCARSEPLTPTHKSGPQP